MKNLRGVFAPFVLALVITSSAFAGETMTPPCAPGETLTPPCTSAPVSGDPTIAGETPANVDIILIADLARDLLLH